ncbi:hypothetical protein FISHEDRAFT_76825 [Fistulina hepatica ATCC 64428]|uniref:Alcohol dehydrogenase-like N-terminal domain-containing protein n=1 Tax=Fistulina hepatica ATCC 64428 TaxID=1128425 RepID=A0A0D7A328_9AGAR|nr:hypothetical protein FISHEDRAFT_76825 [Fistulina hepatica ATCC 64428]
MSKPTLMQTILSKPSQRYSFPADPRYHSTKFDFMRRATEMAPSAAESAPPLSHDFLPVNQNNVQQEDEAGASGGEGSDSEADVFYTPTPSPTASLTSRASSLNNTSSIHQFPSTSSSASTDYDGKFVFSSSNSDTSTPTSESTPSEKISEQNLLDNVVPVGRYRASPASIHDIFLQAPPPTTTHRRARPHKRARSTCKQKPNIVTSMTVLLEEEEDTDVSGVDSMSPPASVHRRRSRSLSSPHTIVTSSGRNSASLAFVDVRAEPYAPALPSHGTPGYTSLTLPRAPMPYGGITRTGGGTSVDLTLPGIAQTTMATVEVVSGLGAEQHGALRRIFTRRRPSTHRSHPMLGFASHRTPPRQVPSDGVLVQVWAVGVDGTDAILVGGTEGSGVSSSDKLRRANVGYIPGRSFVGRVLECGWQVKDETFRKGEWVVGLLDVRKAGALSEFVVVDRHRLYRVPQPQLHGPLLVPPGRRRSRLTNGSKLVPVDNRRLPDEKPTSDSLTLEELALLPLVGVPAYRAARTLFSAIPSSQDDCDDGLPPLFHRDSVNTSRRVLVLNGHEGVGAMAVQMLAKHGWKVSVHAPGMRVPEQGIHVNTTNGDCTGGYNEQEYMKTIEDRARRWGAQEVVFDDGMTSSTPSFVHDAVVQVIESLIDDGDLFDAVLDTIGGRDIWEAAARLLGGGGPLTTKSAPSSASQSVFSLNLQRIDTDGTIKSLPRRMSSTRRAKAPRRYGQFTTTVGDAPDRPIPSASEHFRAGMRSLKTGVGEVGYAWISAAQGVDVEGLDVSATIRVVLDLALKDGIRPYTGEGTVAFETTPDLFASTERLADGRTAVVKIVS